MNTNPMPSAAPCREQQPCSALLAVSRDDLRIVTSAILSRWTHGYTCGSGREVVECLFCGREQDVDWSGGGERIVKQDHAPDCAVLVATSIAPNAAGEATARK